MNFSHRQEWQKATSLIPGGNSQLSKHPERFGVLGWPVYYHKAKGCHIWDSEGKKYTDMSLMGVGTCTLGYGCRPVDEAVVKAVGLGTMSTLNCHEEVELAELLCDLHPWAQMARFARTGGEANAIAIRTARAATGRDDVAICGYHGWHDWYLAANLKNSNNLNNHLFNGLEIKGVPHALTDTVHTFKFNCIESLEWIVNSHKLAAIKMEVHRSEAPNLEFLQQVRKLASKHNIVLIFDECTSGFRETYGGIHLKYGINPDMAVFGKALGNGYPITAIIGTRTIMEASTDSFISSTFWTERIGPVAALATLKEMKGLRSWELITNNGNYLRKGLSNLSELKTFKYKGTGTAGIQINQWYDSDSKCEDVSLTEKMINRGYLSTPLQYISAHHSPKMLDDYLSQLDDCIE